VVVLPLRASEEASRLANPKTMNMIVLGAFLARTQLVELPSIMAALKKVLPERYHHLLPLNEEALRRGMALAGEEVPAGV
jgi:2-oxoglutarate ferredoxin oxidoreductase subunit gamma